MIWVNLFNTHGIKPSYMFELWYIHISLAIVSAIFSILIFLEFKSLRKEFHGKLSGVLLLISVLLLFESVVNAVAFSMWSYGHDPVYVYPSMAIAIVSTSVIILFYYYVAKV
ncbi:hypothetical protein ATY89_09205 [Sulfolobus acidocaldarius]|uniref:Uncharacterized protein n=4 Tax=Sulfolobus acidocaldarius TaxID=2285 RepID=A0A0U2Y5B7_9CREN|nr:hypothetical protein SacN8_08690 [Sulfolobus acidocaldarius N8]AGE73971.1 hypothetical protein SacRon12I_08700 [Sulfolobus acidocaldarius Ron12/I]ALU30095.1 hypothetical protein ATY89_09205 [Sulfolobus acidocaldarius]ALU30785.1 hypothetical protein ATZ20_00615 [Sulfolobus acidocaldarius]WCM35597.1 hypothetical protein GO597_09755 [Sulfolobus acidocaldarius DSM 639]